MREVISPRVLLLPFHSHGLLRGRYSRAYQPISASLFLPQIQACELAAKTTALSSRYALIQV